MFLLLHKDHGTDRWYVRDESGSTAHIQDIMDDMETCRADHFRVLPWDGREFPVENYITNQIRFFAGKKKDK